MAIMESTCIWPFNPSYTLIPKTECSIWKITKVKGSRIEEMDCRQHVIIQMVQLTPYTHSEINEMKIYFSSKKRGTLWKALELSFKRFQFVGRDKNILGCNFLSVCVLLSLEENEPSGTHKSRPFKWHLTFKVHLMSFDFYANFGPIIALNNFSICKLLH